MGTGARDGVSCNDCAAGRQRAAGPGPIVTEVPIMPDVREEILGALEWFGEGHADPDDCDICEDGSVYYGLTQILPPGSIQPEELAYAG